VVIPVLKLLDHDILLNRNPYHRVEEVMVFLDLVDHPSLGLLVLVVDLVT